MFCLYFTFIAREYLLVILSYNKDHKYRKLLAVMYFSYCCQKGGLMTLLLQAAFFCKPDLVLDHKICLRDYTSVSDYLKFNYCLRM